MCVEAVDDSLAALKLIPDCFVISIIKLLGKKGQDKRLIKNWRPIAQLNTDMKIISKVLSTRIKNVLLFLISSSQTAHVKNKFISESGRVI